ncbi:hypothetical protein B0H10DRAFT_1950515 [Mycena sp. CBHHK59/15]|nr:hypothetical protein B0H10DRAFT_1950515 [Mycena sp. CBHHK59/15]
MVATDGNRVHPAHAGKRKHTTTTTPPPPPLPSSIHMRAEGHGTHTWMSPAKKIAKRHSCSQGRKRVNDELKVDNLGKNLHCSGGPDRGLETRGKAQGARGCLKLEEHLRAEAEESLEGDKSECTLQKTWCIQKGIVEMTGQCGLRVKETPLGWRRCS